MPQRVIKKREPTAARRIADYLQLPNARVSFGPDGQRRDPLRSMLEAGRSEKLNPTLRVDTLRMSRRTRRR